MIDKQLLAFFSDLITENKRIKMDAVLSQRTRHVTFVLEDIYQSHNSSAVIRSCDCFGMQDLHIIENANRYNLNPEVSLGSAKWVSIHRYNQKGIDNSEKCLQHIKAKGYAVVATSPHKDQYTLDTIPVDKPLAIFMGTEVFGLSQKVINQADYHLYIPMSGFTESLNLSVTAAICMYVLERRIKDSDIYWQLSEEEKDEIRLVWIKSILKKSELLEEEFYKKNSKGESI